MYELACATKAPKLNRIAFICLVLLYILFLSFIFNLQFYYSNLLFFNNRFPLVKCSFLEQLVDLVKRMSVQDLCNQTNVQLGTGVLASEHHGDNETEGIKPMEFHIKGDDGDAAGSNQVGIAVSRPSRAR